MSAQPKLRAKSAGQPDSELTRFKQLWLFEWSAPVKDSLRELFSGTTAQPEIRSTLKVKHGITLLWNSQLSKLNAWIAEQDELDAEAERQTAEEAKQKQLHPEWGPDELRQAVLAGSYRRTLARGDFKLGLATIREDRGLIETMTNRDKFEFDAAKACLAKLPELKAISTNKELSEDQKLEQARLALFGSAPQ